MRTATIKQAAILLSIFAAIALLVPTTSRSQKSAFPLMETTIDEIHAAYKAKTLTCHQLVQMYLDRIQAYDQNGPKLNTIIALNPDALAEADQLDATFKKSGFVGPLHGIPVLVKDQVDATGMPTTLGSVVFQDYRPPKDSFVVDKLRKAGAVVLGKTTLGEFGGGDTYGSLFGATRNPYDLDRTVGGSSGGSSAGVAANFATIAVGEEGFSSIRRPTAWNNVVGMRPTAGLVSRTGMYDGWPDTHGSLGPIARTVRDLAKMLDVMAAYDPEDPETAFGVGHAEANYEKFLDKNGLKGARIGILRESIGHGSDPHSDGFKKVDAVFDRAVGELKEAGAVVLDPVEIPNVKTLIAKRATDPDITEQSLEHYLSRNPNSPYKTRDDVFHSPKYQNIFPPKVSVFAPAKPDSKEKYHQYLEAREELMTSMMKVMADNRLDAILMKSVEDQPPPISVGTKPPYPSAVGAIDLNTFLIDTSVISVPAGFTRDNLPVGVTFFGRPFSESTLLRLAYAYEQTTQHRTPPKTTPSLLGQQPH
jgi:amidase